MSDGHMINLIPFRREWGLAFVRLNDSSVVALMNQMPKNRSRLTPISSKFGHKNMKERKYFWNQTEIKLKKKKTKFTPIRPLPPKTLSILVG